MDINEPSLMDVAHDMINSTQGSALIEVAYSPSSEGKRQGFICSNSGQRYIEDSSSWYLRISVLYRSNELF
ncbi:hypothetical protein HN51_024887 [Arachis hypogaea]